MKVVRGGRVLAGTVCRRRLPCSRSWFMIMRDSISDATAAYELEPHEHDPAMSATLHTRVDSAFTPGRSPPPCSSRGGSRVPGPGAQKEARIRLRRCFLLVHDQDLRASWRDLANGVVHIYNLILHIYRVFVLRPRITHAFPLEISDLLSYIEHSCLFTDSHI